MIGRVFGRLTVMEISHRDKYSHKSYKCRCECGNEKIITQGNLTTGQSKSCGCYALEINKIRKQNKYIDYGDYVGVKFSNSDNYFLVDSNDWDTLKEYTFYINKSGYACCNFNNKSYSLHTLILKPPIGFNVDHIDGNKLDNRKSNLRVCTHMENSWNLKLSTANTSGYKGIGLDKRSNKWSAKITCNKKVYSLGYFTNIDDAIKARQDAEIKYFGEYRRVI